MPWRKKPRQRENYWTGSIQRADFVRVDMKILPLFFLLPFESNPHSMKVEGLEFTTWRCGIDPKVVEGQPDYYYVCDDSDCINEIPSNTTAKCVKLGLQYIPPRGYWLGCERCSVDTHPSK